MKSLISALLIAAVIITGGLFYTRKLDELSEQLGEKCTDILSGVTDGDFNEAKKRAGELREFMDSKRVLLESCIDHSELDKIEINLEQMTVYIAEEKRADALAYGKALSNLFHHLPKNYQVRTENIL